MPFSHCIHNTATPARLHEWHTGDSPCVKDFSVSVQCIYMSITSVAVVAVLLAGDEPVVLGGWRVPPAGVGRLDVTTEFLRVGPCATFLLRLTAPLTVAAHTHNERGQACVRVAVCVCVCEEMGDSLWSRNLHLFVHKQTNKQPTWRPSVYCLVLVLLLVCLSDCMYTYMADRTYVPCVPSP